MTMIRLSFALVICFMMTGFYSVQGAYAQSSLEDVFRKTIDDLLGKDDAGEIAKKTPESFEEITLSFAPLVRKAAPSVVNVYAARMVQRQRSPFEGNPFFDRFFGNRNNIPNRSKERVQSSLGSGVIVASEGIVLTNNHVIEGADEVKIALNDGSEYECEIILKDEKSDLAVLRVKDGGEFDAIEIANSDDVEVGDLVLAIGNPFGVGQTVTSGIVSAVARSRMGINDFDFFIQTDAAVNPGNSGGALVDMKGRLIGINTAIFTKSGGSIGLGFAIPSNMAQVVIRSANQGDTSVMRPWVGAEFQNVTAEIAESLGMKRPGGILVASLYKNGPAEKAGLKPGDVVIGINRKILANVDEFGYRLDTLGIGADAELIVISGQERKVVEIVLKAAPETIPREETILDVKTVLGGATIANLSPSVSQQIGISSNREGVVVLDLSRPSRAAQNGVKKGDIVLAINGHEMQDVSDVMQITSRQSDGGWQVILLRENRKIVFERNGGYFRQYLQE